MGEPTISSKIVVLLFSDIVGSVNLKTRLGDAGAAKLVGRHDAIFRETFRAFPSATLLQDTGDGFYARFETASDAVLFSLRFQHAIGHEGWGEAPIRVRVGVHLGEVTEMKLADSNERKLSGLAVDLAARVTSLGEGGQILLTRSAFDSARQYVLAHPRVGDVDPPDLRWIAHGPYVMKGSEEPIEVFEVGAAGLAPLKAPGDSEKAKRAIKPGDEEVLGWRPASGLEVPDRKGWVLKQKLGEGGFGEVWLGEHVKTREHRAFKFCFDAERLRSFKRELTLFRLLRSALGDRDDIAHLYEVRLDKPPYFLESEFSEWGNFSDWAASQGGIETRSLTERVQFVAHVARAVAAAHSVGILHKDIKPSNILVHPGDKGQPRPRLTDFGIGILTDVSLLQGRNITVTGLTEGMLQENASSRTGTRMYAPPESLTGAVFTQQGDIYALGVLLYQCVVGDLSRPLAQGWEAGVPDPLLREDIAACVAGDISKRLTSAATLADRLESLPQRRLAAARALRARAVKRGLVIAAAALAIIAGVAVIMTVRERGLRLQAVEARKAEERERLRAEQNLDAVQTLAHTFLFDFDDQIKDLRGATPARRLILTEAEAYLARLQAQARDDAGYLRDLADAYDQVGQLNGGSLSGSRLGDAEVARESFAKAREIREKLLERFPSEARSHGDMGKSLLREGGMLIDARKYAEAKGVYERALAAFERAVELAPEAERVRFRDGRAETLGRLGATARALAGEAKERQDWDGAEELLADAGKRYIDASEHWRRRLERAEGAPAPGSSNAPGASNTPGTSSATGTPNASAVEDQPLGVANATRMLRTLEDERAAVDRERADIPRRRALALLRQGDIGAAKALLDTALKGYVEAKAASLRAVEALEKLSAERPQSGELRRSVAVALHNAGVADMTPAQTLDEFARTSGTGVKPEDGRALHGSALASYTKALEIAEALFRADESNQQAFQDVANYLNKVGNELRDLDRLDEAERVFDRSLAMRRQDLKADPSSDTRFRLGVGLFKRGEIADRRSEAAPVPDRVQLLKDAEAMYAESRAVLREALGADDAPLVREADAALVKVRERLKSASGS